MVHLSVESSNLTDVKLRDGLSSLVFALDRTGLAAASIHQGFVSPSVSCDCLVVFIDGRSAGEERPLPPLMAQEALFPTLTFQNVTLAVNFGSVAWQALPDGCRIFGTLLEKDHARSSPASPASRKAICATPTENGDLQEWLQPPVDMPEVKRRRLLAVTSSPRLAPASPAPSAYSDGDILEWWTPGQLHTDSPIRLALHEMRTYLADWQASTKDVFWQRKSNKAVLSILLCRSESGDWCTYHGMNTEVSLPSGSVCAERAAIVRAASDFRHVTPAATGILSMLLFPTDARLRTWPASPCSVQVCQSWLSKLRQENPNMMVIAFASLECHRFAIRVGGELVEPPKQLQATASPNEALSGSIWPELVELAEGTTEFPWDCDDVVYVDGAWNFFHPGHQRILRERRGPGSRATLPLWASWPRDASHEFLEQEAKQRGSHVLVGIHSDATLNDLFGKPSHENFGTRLGRILQNRFVSFVLKDAPWVVPQDVQRVALTGKPHLAQAVALEDLIQALCIKKVVSGSVDKVTDCGKILIDEMSYDPYKIPRELGILEVSADQSRKRQERGVLTEPAKLTNAVRLDIWLQVREFQALGRSLRTCSETLKSPSGATARPGAACARMRCPVYIAFLWFWLEPAEGLISSRELLEERSPSRPTSPDANKVGPSSDSKDVPEAGKAEPPVLSYLRDSSGRVEEFSSCTLACQQCYQDHFQACLAYCKHGCQDYCEEKMSEEECKAEDPREVWVAKIGSLFDLMQNSGQLCQMKSPDGCPSSGRIPSSQHSETWASCLASGKGQSPWFELIVPVGLPGTGLHDYSRRLREFPCSPCTNAMVSCFGAFLLASLCCGAALRQGFTDCTGEDTSDHGLRRAYRRLALENHPDKGGSNELTSDLTALRDNFLRDPLHFQVFRATFAAELLAFGNGPRGRLRRANASVQLHDGWPYIQVELDLDHGGLLLDGGSWTFAFGLKNASTVHYRGDERTGGYDVCCDFVQDSRCQRRPASNISGPEPKCPKDSATDCHEGISLYTTSDCPLPPLVTASVRRPLHLNITGQWGAALQVKDASGEEVACVAFALAHSMQQTEPATESTLAGSPGGASGLGLDGVGTDNATHQRGASEGPPEVSFQHIGSGQFCEDGGDLLEGALDDYGGLSPFGGARRASAESSMFYGSKCRERCRRKMNCRFYTAYSSGWCQLSSRCALARAGDPLTENPDVLEIGDGMIEEWCLSSGLERSRAPNPEHSSDEPDLEAFGEFDPEARRTLGTLARLSGRSLVRSSVGLGLLEDGSFCT
eukprot:s2574_g8.t4